ncbi:ADH_N domain-containing protein [Psidium guajava]|nr:ADH_N domain-containing protein [Psidium guajava]
MTTAPSPPPPRGNSNPRLPPKRGQIKAQIFKGLVKSVSSAAARAGNFIGLGSTGAPPAPDPPRPAITTPTGMPINLPRP